MPGTSRAVVDGVMLDPAERRTQRAVDRVEGGELDIALDARQVILEIAHLNSHCLLCRGKKPPVGASGGR